MNYHFFKKTFNQYDSSFLKLNFSNYLYLVIIIVYVLVGINSVGYYQEDEHYQLVEFANYKMGWVSADKLAWEFHAQIRPGLQPFICYFIFKICGLISITDGYDLVLVLRLVSLSLSLIAIRLFIINYKSEIEGNLHPFFIGISYLLWFVPFVAARFSSENWSGIFFLFALNLIQIAKKTRLTKHYSLLGLLLGASILFRYQSALLVVGTMLWFILIDKIKLKNLMIITYSIIIMLIMGFFLDHWLYGNFPLTLYNYFFQNIIKGVASNYGISPWYQYIIYIIKSTGPFGILIFISCLLMVCHQPKNVIFWAIIPFILIHSLIPHKELRFLFPLVYLVPLILTLAYQVFYRNVHNTLKYIIIIFALFLNLAGLVTVVTTAASSNTSVSNFIHRNYDLDSLNIIISNGINPYMDWHPPYNTFYSSRGLKIQEVSSIWQPNILSLRNSSFTNIFIMGKNDINGPRTDALFKKYRLKKVFQNIPPYIIPIYNWYNPALNESLIMVYVFE